MEEKILFNDWETRIPGAIKYRKKNYILSLLCTSVLFVMSIIGCIFYWEVIVLLFILQILLCDRQSIFAGYIKIHILAIIDTYGDRWDLMDIGFSGSGDRARVDDIGRNVESDVDAGNYEVDPVLEQEIKPEIYAIGRCAP